MTDSIMFHEGNRRLQDQFDSRRQGFGAGRVLLAAVPFDGEVLSLDLPQPPKVGEEGGPSWRKFTFAMRVQMRA